MTHPVNSSWSILDKSGPGTERGAMLIKSSNLAPASSRFRD